MVTLGDLMVRTFVAGLSNRRSVAIGHTTVEGGNEKSVS